MRALVDQVEHSLASGQYFVSLFTALALPDIAAALDAPDGLATRKRYAMLESLAASLPPDLREQIKADPPEPPWTASPVTNFGALFSIRVPRKARRARSRESYLWNHIRQRARFTTALWTTLYASTSSHFVVK